MNEQLQSVPSIIALHPTARVVIYNPPPAETGPYTIESIVLLDGTSADKENSRYSNTQIRVVVEHYLDREMPNGQVRWANLGSALSVKQKIPR